ncbi:hypothetical protein H8D36_00480 [archaeon]|nr:hypothetical protein [archaeon]MBL7057460.1 hypothetical protein [Candidatus Woesearchaeota archaeon]
MNNKILFWIPRILGIIFAVFISLFAFDTFIDGFTWITFAGFLIHLIPTYLLIIALVIAWKWNLIGGIIYLALGAFYMVIANANPIAFLIIGVPVIVTGGLFILEWYLKKRTKHVL